MVVYTQNLAFEFHSVDHMLHQRDAYTIVDDSVWCTRKRRQPSPLEVVPLRIVNVGSSRVPIIHIKGLLPSSGLLKCQIITPAIGLKTGCWGIRHLTSSEILQAYDMSADLLPASINWRKFLNHRPIPGKIWEVVGTMVAAVDLPLTSVSDSVSPKRLKIDTTKPSALGLSHDTLFSTLHTHKAQQLAVKSDDAGGNVDIWLNYLLHEGGPFFRTLSRTVVSPALDIIRSLVLVWWKRRLLREYRDYMHRTFRTWGQFLKDINTTDWLDQCHGVYVWSITGLDRYKAFWRQRLLLTQSEWVKGCDCLTRA